MKYCVLIPAYQPDEKMLALCEKLCAKDASANERRVLVVDDGSGGAYADLFHKAEACGAILLRHDRNRGKGAAIKTGLTYILAYLQDYNVVTADADGQHIAEDIERIAAAAAEHKDALILGVRNFSKMPPRSRLGNTITRFFFKLETGLAVSDTQTGLRGFSYGALNKLLQIEGERYEYEMNMLLQLKDMKLDCVEIPVSTVYIENNRASHFHTLRDGAMVFSRVLRYSAASVFSALLDFFLYWLLLHWLDVRPSYILARVCSALTNYECNRRAVFKTRLTALSLAGYAALCALCMLVGSSLVKLLYGAGCQELLAKLLVDTALFFINYTVQKKLIFKNGNVACARIKKS